MASTSAVLSSGQRLFVPALNLWYLPLLRSIADVKRKKDCWTLQIGITDRGLDDIGDVSLIRPATPRNFRTSTNNDLGEKKNHFKGSDNGLAPDFAFRYDVGDELVELEWTGHSITAADELYHTVWETISGTKTIHSPVLGNIVNIFDRDHGINEDDVIVEVETNKQSLLAMVMNNSSPRIVRDGDEYEKIIQETQQLRGDFSDH